MVKLTVDCNGRGAEKVVGVPASKVVVVDGKWWNSFMACKEPCICQTEEVEVDQDRELIEVRWPNEAANWHRTKFIIVPGHSLSVHRFGPIITRIFISFGKLIPSGQKVRTETMAEVWR